MVLGSQEVARHQMKFPMDTSAALFLPTKSPSLLSGTPGEVELTEDDLTKGVAAGMAHSVLEASLNAALALYPPP